MGYLVVGDIKSRVKRQFGDESGVQVTDSDIYRWISDSIRNVILSNEEAIEVITTIDIVASQQDYPLPTDIVSLKGITCKTGDSTSYFNLQGYQLEQFNTYVDGWDGQFFGQGNPAIFTIFNNIIKLFPIPDTAAAAGLKLFYTSYLGEITSDSFTISLPNYYFNAVVNYCLQQAYQMDEDWIGAEIMMQQVQQDLTKARGKSKEQQDTYQMITILDDDRW